jgi:hypothetical protein
VAVARKRGSVCVMFMGWGIALDGTVKCCFAVMADWVFSVGVSVLCGWNSGVWIHSLGVFEMKSTFCMIGTAQCELIWND